MFRLQANLIRVGFLIIRADCPHCFLASVQIRFGSVQTGSLTNPTGCCSNDVNAELPTRVCIVWGIHLSKNCPIWVFGAVQSKCNLKLSPKGGFNPGEKSDFMWFVIVCDKRRLSEWTPPYSTCDLGGDNCSCEDVHYSAVCVWTFWMWKVFSHWPSLQPEQSWGELVGGGQTAAATSTKRGYIKFTQREQGRCPAWCLAC